MKFEDYIREFNENDVEYIKTDIGNDEALDFLGGEIPMFECSDKTVEKTYYFRWWTYRKHIKNTPEGYVITEFLPDVSWSGAYNVINAAAGHHISEGRWLRNGERYLVDYINFLFDHPEISTKYSTWLLSAAAGLDAVKGCIDARDFLKKAMPYYESWEKLHGTETPLFWSVDGRDAMEYSISGSPCGHAVKGIRPTLNSYMCADARTIYNFSVKAGNPLEEFSQKSDTIRGGMEKVLWRENFFKAIHPLDGDFSEKNICSFDTSGVPRELIGYIPWCFSIPRGGEEVFRLLEDDTVFAVPEGLATAECGANGFLGEYDHECLWNGYVWPFATSQTLTALLKEMQRSEKAKNKYSAMFSRLLHQYANQHKRITEDGRDVMWIDEVLSPTSHVWTSREILKNLGWRKEKGGLERGKDYNHSTFCDLVISLLTGFSETNGNVNFAPIIPDDWTYFTLDNLYIRGDRYTLKYDRDGKNYGEAGLKIYKNGKIYS